MHVQFAPLPGQGAGLRSTRADRGCCLGLLTAPLTGLYQAVLAAQEKSMVRCPASIVVRPLGVPDHDLGQTDVVTSDTVGRLRRKT